MINSLINWLTRKPFLRKPAFWKPFFLKPSILEAFLPETFPEDGAPEATPLEPENKSNHFLLLHMASERVLTTLHHHQTWPAHFSGPHVCLTLSMEVAKDFRLWRSTFLANFCQQHMFLEPPNWTSELIIGIHMLCIRISCLHFSLIFLFFIWAAQNQQKQQ